MKHNMCDWREAFVFFGVPFPLCDTTMWWEVKKNGCTVYISTYSPCCQGELLWIVFSWRRERGWTEYLLFSSSSGAVLNGEQCHWSSSSQCLLTNAMPQCFCWNSASASASCFDLARKKAQPYWILWRGRFFFFFFKFHCTLAPFCVRILWDRRALIVPEN